MEELSSTLELENPPVQLNENGNPIPEKPITWAEAYQHFVVLYLRYLSIFRKLEDCVDQIIHPQKRRDIKLVLECVMARLVQVKAQCVKFAPFGKRVDFLNLENYLLDLGIQPDSLEVPIPRYFTEKSENDDENKKRDILEKCLEDHGLAAGNASNNPNATDPTGANASNNPNDVNSLLLVPRMSKEQAIRIIMKNERGRQGAVRAKLMKELKEEDAARKRMGAAAAGLSVEDEEAAHREKEREKDPTYAATLIQKIYRGYAARQRVAKMAAEEFVFLGMKPAVKKETGVGGGPTSKYDPKAKEELIRAQRKTRQVEYELKYIESLEVLRNQLYETEGPEMKDEMWEKRYNWWITQKEKTGKYPENFNDYYLECEPNSETAKLLADKLLKKKPKKKKLSKEEKAAEKAKKEKEKAAKEKEKANAKKGSKKEDAAKALELSMRTLVGPTHLITHMHECINRFRGVWFLLDESGNHLQLSDDTLSREKLRPLLREKIQKETDERLLDYLNNIRLKMNLKKQELLKKKKDKASKRKAAKVKKKAAEKERLSAMSSPRTPKSPGGSFGSEKKEDGSNTDKEDGEEGEDKEGEEGADSAKGDKKSKKKKKASKKSKKGGKKKKKCCDGEKACSHMPLGDMINLLVKMGILQTLPKNTPRLKDFLGEQNLIGQDYAQATANPPEDKKDKKGAAGKEKDKKGGSTSNKKKGAASAPSTARGGKGKEAAAGTASAATGPTLHSPPSVFDPSPAQLRAALTENFILPQGSVYVKEQSPASPALSSLLLFGAAGTGKTMLSRAIAAETGSVWLDLSVRNVERKLGTKAEIAKLIHMVFHVAVSLQPAVVYFDEAEKIFLSDSKGKKKKSAASKKKKGGEESSAPPLTTSPEVLKMRAFLLQHKTKLARTDRVLFVGNARYAFDAQVDKKDLLKFFGATYGGRIYPTPLPNYPTRIRLWKTFINETGVNYHLLEKMCNPHFSGGSLLCASAALAAAGGGGAAGATSAGMSMGARNSFDVTTLAFISEGYSAGSIRQAVFATLPPRRVAKLYESGGLLMGGAGGGAAAGGGVGGAAAGGSSSGGASAKMLDNNEFIVNLSKAVFVYRQEYMNLFNFWLDVSGEKDRRKAIEEARVREEEEKAQEKKKGPAKKK